MKCFEQILTKFVSFICCKPHLPEVDPADPGDPENPQGPDDPLDPPESPNTPYNINILESAHGSINTNVQCANLGDIILILDNPNISYILNSITVQDTDGNVIEVTNKSFIMPASDVTITYEFIKDINYRILTEQRTPYPSDYVGINEYEGYTFDSPTKHKDRVGIYVENYKSYVENPDIYHNAIDAMEPAVGWKFEDGKMCWTFSGFTLMKLRTNSRSFCSLQFDKSKACTKLDVDDFLDTIFSENKGFDALDKAIDRWKERLGLPIFQHWVSVMLPYPPTCVDDWGENHLDLRSGFQYMYDDILAAYFNEYGEYFAGLVSLLPEDRRNFISNKIAELKPNLNITEADLEQNQTNRKLILYDYVDTVISRFNNNTYNNIKLAGFLWLEEDIYHGTTHFYDPTKNSRTASWDLASSVVDYVHTQYVDEQNKPLYEVIWNPYLKASGVMSGDLGHFDHVFIQNGYTINLDKNWNCVEEMIKKCSGNWINPRDDYKAGFLIELTNYGSTDLPEGVNIAGVATKERALEYRRRLRLLALHFEENNLWDSRCNNGWYADGVALFLAYNKIPFANWKNLPYLTFSDEYKEIMDILMKHIVDRQNIIYESCPEVE